MLCPIENTASMEINFHSRFGRSITGSDDPHDLDLNSKHYVLFGWSNNKPDAGRLTPHTVGGAPDPSISKHRVNVAKDTGVEHGRDFDSIKRILIRTHGILMLIAWLLLASTGIFFAAHMRPALPNGEWFQVHRAFMIASLFIAMAGFILIFISQLQKQPHGLVQLGSQYVSVLIYPCATQDPVQGCDALSPQPP